MLMLPDPLLGNGGRELSRVSMARKVGAVGLSMVEGGRGGEKGAGTLSREFWVLQGA